MTTQRNKYLITVYDDFSEQCFTGEFFALDENTVKEECKEFYALELGTNTDEIVITHINQIP